MTSAPTVGNTRHILFLPVLEKTGFSHVNLKAFQQQQVWSLNVLPLVGVLIMGKKKDKSYKTFKPRGPLLPPNKRHKSVKDYDRKETRHMLEDIVRNLMGYPQEED